MESVKRFAVIGGDERQVYLAQMLAQRGDFIDAVGLDSCVFTTTVQKASLTAALRRCTHIVLPLPATKDGEQVFAPYSEMPLFFRDFPIETIQGKPIFCGQARLLPQEGLWRTLDLRDYAAREEFSIRNAVATAEGAIQIAMEELPTTLCGTRCLVTGYGRIGRILAARLRDFGAQVSVAARRSEALTWITEERMRPVSMEALAESGSYELIFNTVPAPIFDAHTIAMIADGALYIELASAPYGISEENAKRLRIPIVRAQGIPGKTAPKSAADNICQTIYSMLSETAFS